MKPIIKKIQNVGNSRGIILPQLLLDMIGFETEVSIELKDNYLIIKPISPSQKQNVS